MKKVIYLFFFLFLAVSGYTQSIYNGDLELWDSIHSQYTALYWHIPSHSGANWLGTLNSLANLPSSAQGPGPITVYRTTDSHNGTYAAKLVSHPFVLGANTIFIPGMLGSAVMNMVGVTAWLGNPCPGCKPTHFKGFYKYAPVNGDSCTAIVLASKWNASKHKRDTIGYGKFVQHTAVEAYTQFDVPVSYKSVSSPDSLTILVISSAGFNVINFTGSVGQDGSTMYVDDLSLEYPAGIQQNLMSDVNVNVYPNPASSEIKVELSKELGTTILEIYTMEGKLMSANVMESKIKTIGVSMFSNGTYFYRLLSGNQILNTGTFIKK